MVKHEDELKVEVMLIDLLSSGNNQWTYRKDIKTEKALWDNLRGKVNKNNIAILNDQPLTNNEFASFKQELLSKTTTPFNAAKWLKGENGTARIEIDREDVSKGRLSLIVFEGNNISGGSSTYEVVNQVYLEGKNGTRDRVLDVSLLFNGLPLIHIELKKSSVKDGAYEAFNQIKKYSKEGKFSNNIYSTVQMFIISNQLTTRYFANALPDKLDKKFVFSWRDPDNNKLDNIFDFSKEVLTIPGIHRLLVDYTIISESGQHKQLMILHPYQIHAIEEIKKAVARHESGFIWHATGTGKTLTSFVATKLLSKSPGVDRTVMLVDRKDLDNQTTSEFTKFASEYNTGSESGNSSSNTLIVGTGSTRQLASALTSDSNKSTIIITTRQKLEHALKYAERDDKKTGSHKFKKLLSQHLVFIVDECHRAVSSEGMLKIKSFFPRASWYGFTGTPIFEANQKTKLGALARTTEQQYGPCLHNYTIKDALDDNSVLGFQVEHDNTLSLTEQKNYVFSKLRVQDQFAKFTDDALNDYIDELEAFDLESHYDFNIYETVNHVRAVIRKILTPNNVYTKFGFRNGMPTMSAILTTSSIKMANIYYQEFRKFLSDPDWKENNYDKSQHLREGRVMSDPLFPRIALTHSLNENSDNAYEEQKVMSDVIDEYNEMYGSNYNLETIGRYNDNINQRVARKRAEYRGNGNQVDLVIVVDRLLTGFDSPLLQTLFVDKNLSFAGLIQAYSRTNRTAPRKDKGMIVTYRKPLLMKKQTDAAAALYSGGMKDTGLIVKPYEKVKSELIKSLDSVKRFIETEGEVTEKSPKEVQIKFLEITQRLNRAYKEAVTYIQFDEDFGDPNDTTITPELIDFITNNLALFNTIQGAIWENNDDDLDLSSIDFFGNDTVSAYDIDSAYINELLTAYRPNDKSLRDAIEESLSKLNKTTAVKAVYVRILDDVDIGVLNETEDIHEVKRMYFGYYINKEMKKFSIDWLIPYNSLDISFKLFNGKNKSVPNKRAITDHTYKAYDRFATLNPGISRFTYYSTVPNKWYRVLRDVLHPMREELM